MRSGYIARIREKIGTDLLLLPSVAVLVTDADGRLLMVKDSDRGQWKTIGGAIELDEEPANAARREAMEEAGVVVGLDGIRGVAGGPGFAVEYLNGDQTAYVSIVFDAHVEEGVPTPDQDEVTEVAWVATGDLGDLDLTPFTVNLLTAVEVLA